MLFNTSYNRSLSSVVRNNAKMSSTYLLYRVGAYGKDCCKMLFSTFATNQFANSGAKGEQIATQSFCPYLYTKIYFPSTYALFVSTLVLRLRCVETSMIWFGCVYRVCYVVHNLAQWDVDVEVLDVVAHTHTHTSVFSGCSCSTNVAQHTTEYLSSKNSFSCCSSNLAN